MGPSGGQDRRICRTMKMDVSSESQRLVVFGCSRLTVCRRPHKMKLDATSGVVFVLFLFLGVRRCEAQCLLHHRKEFVCYGFLRWARDESTVAVDTRVCMVDSVEHFLSWPGALRCAVSGRLGEVRINMIMTLATVLKDTLFVAMSVVYQPFFSARTLPHNRNLTLSRP